MFEDFNIPACCLNLLVLFLKLYRLTQKGTEVAYRNGQGSQEPFPADY